MYYLTCPKKSFENPFDLFYISICKGTRGNVRKCTPFQNKKTCIKLLIVKHRVIHPWMSKRTIKTCANAVRGRTGEGFVGSSKGQQASSRQVLPNNCSSLWVEGVVRVEISERRKIEGK